MFTKLAALLYLASTAHSALFHVRNQNPGPVFVQVLGTNYPDPFTLQPGQQVDLTFNEPWSGRIWGRIDCFSVGDCYGIPVSLAEITVGNGNAWYDLSLVDGYNMGLAMEPVGGQGDGSHYRCNRAECSYPILNDCPDELKLFNAAGQIISCESACSAFNDDFYCCRGDIHGVPENCKSSDWPVDYASFFKARCPDAYSYAYDDLQSTFTCDADEYNFIFL